MSENKTYSLLDIANEIFKDSRQTTPEESKIISDFLKKKAKKVKIEIKK